MTEDFKDKVATKIRVRSSCKGGIGIVYDRQHLLDLSELKGVSRIGEPPLLKIAKSLGDLPKDIQHLATGFNKPTVNVFTHEDRERERKEWEKRRAHERAQRAPE